MALLLVGFYVDVSQSTAIHKKCTRGARTGLVRRFFIASKMVREARPD